MKTTDTKKKAATKAPKAPTARQPKAAAATTPTPTKAALLIVMLQSPDGTTLARMSEKTGWLPHSVRGFLAGTLRKKHGLEAVSEKIDGARIYRIAAAEPAA